MTKNFKLLFTMLLLVLGGANSVWGKIVFPTVERCDRTNAATASDWNSGYPKSGFDNIKVEANYNGRIWFVDEFEIPNIDNASEIKLAYTRSTNSGEINVYLFPYDIPDLETTFDNCSTYLSNVNTVIGSAVGNNGTINTPFKSIAYADGNEGMSVTLNAADITTLKNTFTNSGTSLIVRFLICSSTDSSEDTGKTGIHSASAPVPQRRPHLTVSYSDITKVIQKEGTDFATEPSSLADAISNASDGDVILLNDDVTLTARLNINKSLTFKAAEGRDVCIYTWTDFSNAMMIDAATSKTILFDGSASGASLAIDHGNVAKNVAVYEAAQTGTTTTFKDVTIRNTSTTQTRCLAQKSSGVLVLDNVTFQNCKSTQGVIFTGGNEKLTLKSDIAFVDCAENNICIEGNNISMIDNSNAHSNPYLIAFNNRTSVGNFVKAGTVLNYRITNPGYIPSQNGDAVYVTPITGNSYTLTVTSAGMSTLVLPFNAEIPAGASSGTIEAYKLTTSGSVVTANKVNSIAKDQPVLIVGDADSYTFTGDATADYSTTAPQNGALIGTYYAIDAEDDNYVLQKQGDEVGFYKLTASSNHVINPFRAYLSGDPNNSTARLSIVFEESDVTGITDVNNKWNAGRSNYYDLSGRRVDQPTKGLYIVNGKKVVVK